MVVLDQSVLFLLIAVVTSLVFLEHIRAAFLGLRSKMTLQKSRGRCPFASSGEELINTVDEIEVRVKKREDDGDVRGAMELLLAYHKANPTWSHAVKVAHELSQRHPDVFGSDGCPATGGSMAVLPSQDSERVPLSTPERTRKTCEEPVDKDDVDLGARLQAMSASSADASGKQDVSPWERGWRGSQDFKPPLQESSTHAPAVDDEAPSPRNFTIAQLNTFDGCQPAKSSEQATTEGSPRPIYIAIRGQVYDASAGRDLYGPGGRYSVFAGHDISRYVARGLKPGADGGKLSATNNGGTDLDHLSLEGFGRFELMTLAGWEDTFAARGYPILGRVVNPPSPRRMSRTELRKFNGSDNNTVPAGYATPPIYVGVKDHVFDVSFGGSPFYRGGGAYKCLAGRDASRVLAKMSMTPDDVEGLLDYSCITDRELKNLDDWVQRLGDGKGYPVIGWIDL